MHHAPRLLAAGAGEAQPAQARGLLVFLPPWADEMNKSRRMVRLQAQLLAQQGCAVLRLDLSGCGDSSGDHGDATWEQWVEDGQAACAWLVRQYPDTPLILWGLRAGCLLACQVAAQLPTPASLLLWNPPANGRVLWQQFLRLATASSLTSDAGKARADTIKQRLQQGLPVEIAGYEVNAALAQGLESSTLMTPESPTGLALLETSPQADADLSPANQATAARWQALGHRIITQRVQGPAFWQTTEIEDAPALLPATLHAVAQLLSPAAPGP